MCIHVPEEVAYDFLQIKTYICQDEFSVISSSDDENMAHFVLAGPNRSSRQKAGPQIDLPLLPTLSKSREEN